MAIMNTRLFAGFGPHKRIFVMAVSLGIVITTVDIMQDWNSFASVTGREPNVALVALYNIPSVLLALCSIAALSLIIARTTAKEHEKEQALIASQRNLTDAERIARLGSWAWTIDSGDIQWSDEIFRIFGLAPGAFTPTYEGFLQRVHADDRETVKRAVVDALARRAAYELDHRILLPEGSVRIVHEKGDLICDEDGIPIRMIGTVQDVTDQRKTEAELRRLSTIIDESINIVIVTGSSGDIEYVNPMFERVTGYSKDEVIGKNPRILASGHSTADDYRRMWQTINEGHSWRGIFRNRKKDGTYYWGNGLITPIRDAGDRITNFLAIQEDITDRMLAQDKAEYLASHDVITGLGNRVYTMAAIVAALERFAGGTLILIDIDGFKSINDSYGVNVGDQYLKDTADIINDHARKRCAEAFDDSGGFIGRLGEDEFAVFLPTGHDACAHALSEDIRKTIEAHRLYGSMIRATVSVGIASYAGSGFQIGELLGRVNAAVYRAKEIGRNRCYFYSDDDADITVIRTKLWEKDRILRALDDDRFVVWHQPIMRISDGAIHHFESLVRMVDEDGTLRMPGAFIGVAESVGLISQIDRVVMEWTMLEESRTTSAGRNWHYSVNLSGRDVGDEDVLVFLKSKARELGTMQGRIILEITETAAIRDFDRAVRFMSELKERGFSLALDDFGVGFTSFSYLRKFPVDYIKIDGSFIRNIHQSIHDQSVVKAIVDIAHAINIQTIAEFVELPQELEVIRALGVDYAQGYLIGKPAPELPV